VDEQQSAPDRVERRTFFSRASGLLMGGGLLAAYGTFGAFCARYLYPAKGTATQWMYVADVKSVKPGASFSYRTPSGAEVAIARTGADDTAASFIALSSICPHLGCQVHWESQNDRFFCPCHNGVFTPEGVAIEGPPAKAGQSLKRFPLKVENGLLYVEAPTQKLASASMESANGHDDCLRGTRDRTA